MWAARLVGKEKAELADLSRPEPAAGEVLLRITRCGICGSDLHAFRGRWGEQSKVGHEFCGVVQGGGPQVEHPAPGTRVAGECFAHCGRCKPCRRGDYNHCESMAWNPGRPAGALAEFMTYPAASLLAVPEALTDEQVAMVEPLAVAFRAVSRAGLKSGQSLAVVGAGTIGLLCAAVASVQGASPLFLLAKHPHQAEKASELGIARALMPAEGDPRELIAGQTGGRGVDAVIDSVACGTSLSIALSLVAAQGRVVEVGGVTRPLLVALGPLVGGEIQMTGSSSYAVTQGRRDFEWAVDLIAEGRVKPQALITHTFPLSEVAEAFRTAADKKTGSIKVMVAMEP